MGDNVDTAITFKNKDVLKLLLYILNIEIWENKSKFW